MLVSAQGIGSDANCYLDRLAGRGLDHSRIEVIYHGVEVDRFMPPPSPPHNDVNRATTVAWLIPRKNHQLLLRAFTKLPADLRWRTMLGLVGGSTEHPGLERLARELGIADKVEFVGWPPHDEMISGCSGGGLLSAHPLRGGVARDHRGDGVRPAGGGERGRRHPAGRRTGRHWALLP